MPDKWEKVLFKNQKYLDNYVDPTFLSDLRKNVNLYHYSWWEAVVGVCYVTHEVCCTVLFVLIFVCMKENYASIAAILSLLSILTISLFIVVQISRGCRLNVSKIKLYDYLKSGMIFFTFGYMFSPILKTLTQTISTDTIYAMVVFMMISHVVFQDYGSESAIVSTTLSLNSALFAAVCLASRLPTVMQTFVLMVNAVVLFVLIPLMRNSLENNSHAKLLVTILFFLPAFSLLIYLSTLFTVLFTLLCVCVNVFFPSLFVYCQKYKENIFGPWDEAIVKSE